MSITKRTPEGVLKGWLAARHAVKTLIHNDQYLGQNFSDQNEYFRSEDLEGDEQDYKSYG